MIAKYSKASALTLILFALSGCAADPNKVHAAAEQDLYPTDYEAQIKQHFGRTLKDPYSAVYEISPPRPGRVFVGLLFGGFRQGYVVQMTVNAKNSFGGYTGVTPYWVLFKRGKIDYIASQGETF